MKRWLILFGLTLLTALAGVSQTITLNDASNAGCIISATNPCPRAGLNVGQPSGSQPQFKNLLQFANAGFEPPLMQQIYQFSGTSCSTATIPCTTSQFQWNISNTQFEGYDTNQWVGATFTVIQGCYSGVDSSCTGGGGTSDPAFGCSGTIATSTNNSGAGPSFTTSAPCGGKLGIAGQVIVVKSNNSQSNALGTTNGWPTSQATSGTASITADTTDLCTTCGLQAAHLTASAGGSATLTVLNTAATVGGAEKTLTLNGTYTLGFWAKLNSGATNSITANLIVRNGSVCISTGCNFTPTLTSGSWVLYTTTEALNETASPSDPFNYALSIKLTGAADAYVDNIAFIEPGTNPTVYSDNFVNALKTWCQSTANTTGPGCTLRYGPSPDSETMADWVLSDTARQPSAESFSTSFSTGYFTQKTGLYDTLSLNNAVGAIPVLIIPVTITTADAANLVDYLQDGAGSTTYGAIRQAQGQTAAWVCASGCPFTVVYLEFGNENWNADFLGHNLTSHANNPNNYYDYAVRMGVVLAAARARQTAQSYSTATTQWFANGLTSSTTDFKYLTAYVGGQLTYSGGTITPTQGTEDGIEFHRYYGLDIATVSTTGCTTNNASCPLYGPTEAETYSDFTNSSSAIGYQQSMAAVQAINFCGPSHTATCKAATYEGGISPDGASTSTSGPFTQAVSDSFTPAGWHLSTDAVGYQLASVNNFAYTNEYQALQYFIGQGGVNVKIWGSMLDYGGDSSVTNSALWGGALVSGRPQMAAAMVTNYCKIGQEVTTSGASMPTYNVPSNSNGVTAQTGVPYLVFDEYASGTTRCILITNTDLVSSHAVTLAGTNVPTTVTQYQAASPAQSSTNEAANLGNTSTTASTVYPILTSSVNVGSGFTAPPMSTTALLFNTVTPLVAVDFGSRSGGSSIAAQAVCTNVGGLSGTNPLADIAAAGITCARVFANQLQACPSVYTSCSWTNLNSILTLVTGAGFTSAILNIVGTSPDLGASGCAPPSSAANWATAVQSMIADVTTNYPTLKISLEIGNEYDLGTVGGTYPTTFWCPPSGHTVLGDYNTLIHTAGPQIHTAYPTLPILIGVLGSPVANGSAWFNTSTGIFSASGWSSPPSQVSASYHAYLGDAASWAAQYAQDMGSSGTANLLSTMQGLAGSVPVQVTETNTGSSFTPTPGPAYPVRNQVAYMPMWIANMYISYLNAGTVPADISFYGDQGGTGATSFFCIEGLVDTNMDCNDSSFQRYPQWYAFSLFQSLLGLNGGGNVAASISPGTNATGVTCTAFYTSTGNAFACVNPTGTAQTSQPIAINNTGYGSATATQYLLNASNPTIASSSLSLTSAGGTSYTGTVTVPANSTLGVLIQAATVTAPTRVFVLMP